MRNKRMWIGALGAAGVLAVTGSAFTASSTWLTPSDASINFGRVEQVIDGFDVVSVDYDYVPDSDVTTSITVVVEQLLENDPAVMRVEVDGTGADESALQDCTGIVLTDANTDGIDDGSSDYSTVTCDIADVVIENSVRFVVEG